MIGGAFRIIGLLLAVLLVSMPGARAQSAPSPSPEALAAARELVASMHFTDQFKEMIPTIIKTFKPAIVQGRGDVERDFDAITPILVKGFGSRLDELLDAVAIIYASNFSAEDLRGLRAFYSTPLGQRFLQKAAPIGQQAMLAGQRFGQSVAADLKQRIIEELRKKGHNI